MNQIVEIILTSASIITSLGVILGVIFTVNKWILNRKKNDKDIRDIKEEQSIPTKGVLACLKGLKEQGCDGPVTFAIDEIQTYLNKQAHR